MIEVIKYAENINKFPSNFNDKIIINSYLTTRGFQMCPFSFSCKIGNYGSWNEDIKIKSQKNGRELTINSGTAHLAKEHHLLEKDNEYGISAKEFYNSFM